jgi:hypothetical protein
MFSGNQAINNSVGGFSVTVGLFRGGPITLQGNLASGGGTGFEVDTGFQNESFAASFAQSVQLLGNVAVHNAVGFAADLPGQIVGNTAAGNSQFGFLVVPGGAPFVNNSAIGNEWTRCNHSVLTGRDECWAEPSVPDLHQEQFLRQRSQ